MKKQSNQITPADQLLQNEIAIHNLLQQRIYDPNKRPDKEQVVMTIQNKTIATLQNFITYAGLPKAGKSSYMAATIASAYNYGADIFGIKINLPVGRNIIAYFDTESSEYDFYRQIDKIKKFCNRDVMPDSFAAFSVREDSPETIKAMVNQFLDHNPECSIVIIDGLLDLLNNFNDELESKALINWIKRITKIYNCTLFTVLHLGKNAGNTIGHSGSMSDRYAQSTLEIVKNKESNTYVLSAKFLRSSDDFSPIEIINVNGEWQQTYSDAKPIIVSGKKEYSEMDHKRNLLTVFNGIDVLSYRQLLENITEVYAIGNSAGKRMIQKMREKNLITKKGDGYERTF